LCLLPLVLSLGTTEKSLMLVRVTAAGLDVTAEEEGKEKLKNI